MQWRLSITHQSPLRKQEEFVKGLFALYWNGVADTINVGHNKLPADAKFTPLEVWPV
jgi:hypothetical protein